MKRLLAVGRHTAATSTLRYAQDGWVVEEVKHHPLSRQELEELERAWPVLQGPELTPAECEEWFNERFGKQETA